MFLIYSLVSFLSRYVFCRDRTVSAGVSVRTRSSSNSNSSNISVHDGRSGSDHVVHYEKGSLRVLPLLRECIDYCVSRESEGGGRGAGAEAGTGGWQ
ncbi:hypothetical protein E2C01_095155 [Portunus trituberculatus]|uniref:Uncharacterized protein n=1 Tax=Portunus trituberculatus TaxID=210409 RepID=A0A5B7K507_PORTR|nr:hypothetical protein [Portunus trituberculatus]